MNFILFIIILINLMPELKNPIFIKNITDPKTGKHVKKIFQIKLSKLNRIVEPMVWEYFKNRANMSIEDVYKKYNGYQLKIIFFNDPIIYTINTDTNLESLPKNSTMIKQTQQTQQTQQTSQTSQTSHK